MAKVDEEAVANGLSITQMMEYAGLNIARFAKKAERIIVLVGKGHNGGDGLAAARHLINWGHKVEILFAIPPEELKEASVVHYKLLKKMNADMKEWDNQEFKDVDLIIDALLGYNIDGDPRGKYAELIDAANRSGKHIQSIDIPSGLDASTGEAYSPCIKAHQTLTLALPKTGLTKKDARPYVGEISVADLGIPDFIYSKSLIKVPEGLFASGSIISLSPEPNE